MEPSANKDERKDDCGDKQGRDDEATTSKDVNDPVHTAYNVNDLKAFEFNSADDVRQKIKELITDKESKDTVDVKNDPLIQHGDAKTDAPIDACRDNRNEERVVIVNVGKISNEQVAVETRKKPNRKRPGRPSKCGPSKRCKKRPSAKVFYIGKLSNFVFTKRGYRHSSSDGSIVS